MSEQDEPGLESLHGDDQAPSVSTSWGYFLGGSTVLALIALTGSAVLAQFLEHRPVNLCPLTQHFASLIDETIRDHYVPEENIHRAEPELRRDDRSALFFYAFEVEVPPQLNPEKIAGMVRDSLHQRMLEVQEMPVENALTGLSLAISGREFARIVFRVPKVVAPAPLEDLRAPATHLAQEMFAFFVAQGIPEKNIVQESAQEQRDESAIWVQTVLRASAQDAVPWTQWLAALAQQSMQHNAEIRQSTAPTGESAIEGWLAQRLAVRAIILVPESSAKNPSAADLADVVQIALPALDELALDSTEYYPEHAEGEAEEKPVLHQPAPAPEPTPAPAPEAEKPHEGEPVKPVPTPEAEAPNTDRPRIAIIMDDGGYKPPNGEPVLELDPGLTLSILPNTPYCGPVAEAALAADFEVMIHMPMETHSRTVKPVPGQLTTTMDSETIIKLTESALDQIPGVVGANNHTGSMFTSDAGRMRIFLEILKKRGLFFVDSLTISTSQAYETAVEMEVPAATRDVFLDHEGTVEYFRAQYQELLEIARERGEAIGIGHFLRKNTIDLLREELPKLEAQGIELVHASELVR